MMILDLSALIWIIDELECTGSADFDSLFALQEDAFNLAQENGLSLDCEILQIEDYTVGKATILFL